MVPFRAGVLGEQLFVLFRVVFNVLLCEGFDSTRVSLGGRRDVVLFLCWGMLLLLLTIILVLVVSITLGWLEDMITSATSYSFLLLRFLTLFQHRFQLVAITRA